MLLNARYEEYSYEWTTKRIRVKFEQNWINWI